MAQSSFDYKLPTQAQGGAWTMPWAPGAGLSSLFALYPSKGDATIDTATTIPSLLDGPIQVARYGALTVNAALTLANRCRGGVILADSLSMGAAGSISMTARGAAGSSKWAHQDIGIPTGMVLSGKNTGQAAFLAWLASTGYCIFDPTLFACPMPGMGDVQADWSTWPAKMAAIVSAAGCGSFQHCEGSMTSAVGNAGTNAPGGGGTGGTNQYTGISGQGRVWGGGVGGGGQYSYIGNSPTADQYGGQGGNGAAESSTSYTNAGGAGNPGGSVGTVSSYGTATIGTGTGGILIIIVRGAVTLTSGHALTANGSKGGGATATLSTYAIGGGGSGGGFVGLYYSGTLTGTPNLTATGGAGGTATGGTYNVAGGAGGAGSTKVKTFSAMGWV